MAGVITTVTLIDELKLIILDPDGKLMSDDQYTRIILQHILPEQTFILQKVSTGYYVHQGDELWLWKPSFTVESTPDYILNARGSIVVTSGTDTRTQISVTGARVDFDEVVCEVLLYLAIHRCQQVSESGNFGSVTPEEVYQKLMTMLQNVRGSYVVC